jgi:hypothetical protein
LRKPKASRQTFSPITTPTSSTSVILHTYPPMKMEQTECSEMLAYKIQMLWNYPEESIQNELLDLWREVVGPDLRNCHRCLEFEGFVMVNVLISPFWDVAKCNSVGKCRHSLMYTFSGYAV